MRMGHRTTVLIPAASLATASFNERPQLVTVLSIGLRSLRSVCFALLPLPLHCDGCSAVDYKDVREAPASQRE